ncbi:MAG: relaxase/mobilization nuclease domain-containing protein [Chitinophagales bacterium]
MILKSLSRKTATYKNLLNYLFKSEDSNNVILRKNIKGNSLAEWVHEFKMNEQNRVIKRINNNKILHDIISISKDDYKNITVAKMKDIGNKYLQLRGDNIIGVGTLHMDKRHAHLHFMISPVEIYTGRSVRISKEAFKEIKKELQQYHIQKYPELVHSVVNHDKKKERINEQEYQVRKRTNGQTIKEQYKTTLINLIKQSSSYKEFYKHLKDEDFELYERKGILTGIVKGNKKYRFKTIGFDSSQLQKLDIKEQFNAIRGNSKDNEHSIER